tara:strand:- start:1767 stop:2060 length:294 start_codon:yes stop_codon:yes gene_type:complete
MEFERSAKFLNFTDGEEKLITISDWHAEKSGDVLFKCYIDEENGAEVDKFWFVWDFDLAQDLKKVTKGKKPYEKVKLKVSMTEIDEFDKEFKVKKLN